MTNLSFRHAFLVLKELLISLSEVTAASNNNKKILVLREYSSTANNS